MMSLSTIVAMSSEAAAKAAREKKEPYIVEAEDIIHLRRNQSNQPHFPFPFIGSYMPKGWKKVDTLFVDSSGFGADDEPAMSTRQFVDRLEVGKGYAVVEAGQFQVYVGVFERQAEKKPKQTELDSVCVHCGKQYDANVLHHWRNTDKGVCIEERKGTESGEDS